MRIHYIEDFLMIDVRECLTTYYNERNDFESWCYTELKQTYVDAFEEKLGKLKQHSVNYLWNVGECLGFAITAYVRCNRNYTLKNILDFAELYIASQFDKIENWADIISKMDP